MVHNGILMETIGISVMVSIGLLLFLSAEAFSKKFLTHTETSENVKFDLQSMRKASKKLTKMQTEQA